MWKLHTERRRQLQHQQLQTTAVLKCVHLLTAGYARPGLWQVHSAPGPHPGASTPAARSTLGGRAPAAGGGGSSRLSGSYSQVPGRGNPSDNVSSGGGGFAGGGGNLQHLATLWSDDSLLSRNSSAGAAAAAGGGSNADGGQEAGKVVSPFNPFADQRA